jgi:TetR/AcrR family transcriptional regulator, transcriptional repressor for nem operon
MRYPTTHKQESRSRIIQGIGRGFRKLGYGGIGVDGLAKEAGVTSGAFYGHFGSKTEAFRTAVSTGLQELHAGIKELQAHKGKRWIGAFAKFYLSTKRTCDLAESCALQSLSSEVARSDPETKDAYERELLEIAETIAAGLSEEEKRDDRAWALLALLSGGVTLARAVNDPELSERIARAVTNAVKTITTSKN